MALSEDLKLAFAPIAKLKLLKSERVEIDLTKVADAIIADVSALHEAGSGHVDLLAALEKKIDSISDVLEKAEEVGDKVMVSPEAGGGLADAFKASDLTISKVDASKDLDDDSEEIEKSYLDDEDEDEGSVKKSSKVEKAEGDEEDEEGEADWPNDMSPAISPILKSERMTSGEVPIMARVGGGKAARDHLEKREKALSRRAERRS